MRRRHRSFGKLGRSRSEQRVYDHRISVLSLEPAVLTVEVIMSCVPTSSRARGWPMSREYVRRMRLNSRRRDANNCVSARLVDRGERRCGGERGKKNDFLSIDIFKKIIFDLYDVLFYSRYLNLPKGVYGGKKNSIKIPLNYRLRQDEYYCDPYTVHPSPRHP